MKPEMLIWRLEPMGPAQPGETRRLGGTGRGVARQESAGRVFGQAWTQPDLFLRSKPGLLAGCPHRLQTPVLPINAGRSHQLWDLAGHSLHCIPRFVFCTPLQYSCTVATENVALELPSSAKVQIDYRLRYAHTRTRAAHSKLPVDPCATRSL